MFNHANHSQFTFAGSCEGDTVVMVMVQTADYKHRWHGFDRNGHNFGVLVSTTKDRLMGTRPELAEYDKALFVDESLIGLPTGLLHEDASTGIDNIVDVTRVCDDFVLAVLMESLHGFTLTQPPAATVRTNSVWRQVVDNSNMMNGLSVTKGDLRYALMMSGWIPDSNFAWTRVI